MLLRPFDHSSCLIITLIALATCCRLAVIKKVLIAIHTKGQLGFRCRSTHLSDLWCEMHLSLLYH